MFPLHRVKHICQLGYGDSLPREEEFTGDVPVFGSNGQYATTVEANTKAPAIIVGRKGSYGKINWTHTACFASDTTFFIDKRFTNADLRWLYWSLQTLGLDMGSQEAAVPGLNREAVYENKLPYPDLDWQRCIAGYLDRETARIDALVAEKEKMLALLEEKRTALISHAVTRGLNPDAPMKPSGLDWLGEIPAHWHTSKFSWEVFIIEGQVDPEDELFSRYILIAPNHIESGAGRILMTETAHEQGAISGKYLCQPGDVIYSKIRPALRKVVMATEECLCSADMYPLRPLEHLAAEYLFYLLLSDEFSTWAILESQRVAMPKINRETLNDLRIPIPTLSEQKKITKVIAEGTARIEIQYKAIQDSIDLLKQRRAALITAAVTGQLDLKEIAA